jgi:2-phosphoglycerate kinase
MTPPTNRAQLVIHNQKDVKARRIILDGVKDHLIPHLSGKNSARDMWEALKSLFQNKNENHKMVLREKLRETKMTGSDMVTMYLTRIREVRDELAAIGEAVDDSKLVSTVLKGFTKEWTSFIKGIMACEKLLDWLRL